MEQLRRRTSSPCESGLYVTTPSGTKTTKTVWSGSELALELDSDGTRYTYLWGPGRIPLSVTAKTAAGVSATFAYQVDAMGSVIGMTDEEGTVVARYSYDPWGNPSPCTPGTDPGLTARNPLRYRAYYADVETGLYYMPARYYDPATYRFLSADPAAPSAGDPGSLNAFAYCGNDPVGLDDPSGADPPGKGIHKKGTKEYDDHCRSLRGIPAEPVAQPAREKAAKSTVFGVLSWTIQHRSSYMTDAMYRLYHAYVLEYGFGGPERFSWTAYSQKAQALVRAKLLGDVDVSTEARWAKGRLNQGSFQNWRSDIPWERRFVGGCVQTLGGTTGAGVVLIAVGIETAPVGVGVLLMVAGAGLIYFDYKVWQPAVTDWTETPYYPRAH
ncbi:MAG: hypothetical protein CVT66_10255 [Actinobacteria bacterium HGW-Actinobacteria-6]|nr:MAG: hypothetical protein CVT66_10255 [Actinobacteria bacterium HGW-Actinobacteria-6]